MNENDLNREKDEISSIKIDSLKELKKMSIELFSQTSRKVQIYTRDLDPRILNNREVESELSKFVRSSRNARVEILIADEKNMQGVDHLLINLAQKYTSYVKIRVIPKDFQENYFAFYLVDGRHIIHRTMWDRFESEKHSVPSSFIQLKTKYFDEVWQQATPASHLRALHI